MQEYFEIFDLKEVFMCMFSMLWMEKIVLFGGGDMEQSLPILPSQTHAFLSLHGE